MITAHQLSSALRMIHAGALASIAAALHVSPSLMERESLYQPLGTLAPTAHWMTALALVSSLLLLSNALKQRWFRLIADSLAALIWVTIATLIGGVSGINMGTGIYGFMFTLSVIGCGAEMNDWLDASSRGTRLMKRVQAAGDKRLEKL